MCPQLAVSLGKWSSKNKSLCSWQIRDHSGIKTTPRLHAEENISIVLYYIVCMGIRMHQVAFWRYLSFPWVNNSWSSRTLSYEYYRWYTWGYLAVSGKQMNSFGGEMRCIHHCVFTLLNKSFHGHATKLQLHLLHTEALIMIRKCKGGRVMWFWHFVVGYIHSVWSSQSQINHCVTVTIKEAVGS